MAKAEAEYIARLPFVVNRKRAGLPEGESLSGLCFWHVKPTGSYGADCEIGNMFAIAYLGLRGGGPPLQWIVLDMIEQGRSFSGIEIGFLGLVGKSAAFGGAPATAMSDHITARQHQLAWAA